MQYISIDRVPWGYKVGLMGELLYLHNFYEYIGYPHTFANLVNVQMKARVVCVTPSMGMIRKMDVDGEGFDYWFLDKGKHSFLEVKTTTVEDQCRFKINNTKELEMMVNIGKDESFSVNVVRLDQRPRSYFDFMATFIRVLTTGAYRIDVYHQDNIDVDMNTGFVTVFGFPEHLKIETFLLMDDTINEVMMDV